MIDDIKELVKTDNAIIGTKETLRLLKEGKVKRVFVTSNCPDDVKQSIAYYAELSGAAVEQIPIPNDELGVICRKQFSISVLAERQ